MKCARALTVGAILVAWTAPPATGQPLQERWPACLACHGENGQSQNPEVPSLGGQPAFYVTVQLLMFRDRMRVSEPMNSMTQGLSDDDLRKLADLVSKLPAPQPIADALDPARAERARVLIQRNRCNICHRPNFSGEENAPRLAGQREDYLLKSLRGYKDNTRRGYDTQMADVVEPLGDADFTELAAFLTRAR